MNRPPASPEARRGFLLNHIISELLPPREDGYRYANADPVTGQAAWFDLRVRIERCADHEAGETAPQFPSLARANATPRLAISQFGAAFKPEAPPPEQGTHREFVGNREQAAESIAGLESDAAEDDV